MNRAIQPRTNGMFVVPPDYDRTPSEKKVLNNYILDYAITRVIQEIFVAPSAPHDWSTWAANNPIEAPKFFSCPYSRVASTVLGYLEFGNMEQQGAGQYVNGFFLSSEAINKQAMENSSVNQIDQDKRDQDK
jgi:hypothetical protein